MACGYGACYGCVVEIDGALKRLCLEGPVLDAARVTKVRASNRVVTRCRGVRILNASGCLDALAAPEVARQLDAFVTKTVTPLPREGNAPPRIVETAHGMLNAIGLANPGRERFLAEHLPRLRELGIPLWVSVGGFCADDYAETCSGLADIEAIELNLSCPNVDEAADSAAEIVAACRARDRAAPVREALGCAPRRRGGRARGRCSRRGRALADQHAAGRRARQAPSAGARARQRRPLGPGAEAGRAPCGERLRTRPRACRSSAWAGSNPAATRSSSPRAERVTLPSERSSSPTPGHPRASAPSSLPPAPRPALSLRTTQGAWQKARKPSEKSPLEASGCIGKIGRP